MVSFAGFLLIYISGGLTFLPLVLLFAFIYNKGGIQTLLPRPTSKPVAHVYKDPDTVIVKKGWVRITNQYQPKMPDLPPNNHGNNNGIISGLQSYVGKEQQRKGLVYAILKHGSLFCYESEKQQEVIMVIPIQDFSVSLYPPLKEDTPEGLIYSRTVVVRLVPKSISPHDTDSISVCTLPEEDITVNPNRILYLTCARNIDKEDWYLGLVEAQHVLTDPEEKANYVMMDSTHFDPNTMEELIRQVQSSPSHRETAWINAVFGRLFLGMYKTDRLKNFVENKIRKKIDKTKRPTFLDEITVRKVDIGGTVPFITDPKLLSLSPQGEVIVEAKVDYHGGLTIEIETDFNWSYSSLMKPIRMHLVLSVKLKKLAGRMMFKLKAPPTNRYWLAFFEMPEMEWEITPIVADKQIKLSIVTNAIESRIREVMAETFVLPNMDDTPFCPSGGKGGIFGEYIKVKQKKKSNTRPFVHEENSDRHSRQDSGSSEHSNVRDTPTVPEVAEKPAAADVLKLPSRRAESATELAVGVDQKNELVPDHAPTLETSYSTPAMQVVQPTPFLAEQHNQSTISLDQKSTAESTHSTGSNKWQTTGSYIRKRMHKGVDEDHSDSESVKSTNKMNQSGFLNKISNFLPADSVPASDSASVKSASSTNSNKRNSLIHMAENFLTKKANGHDDTISEEKKGMYAERIANMRKRAGEKIASISNIGPPLPPPIVNKYPPISNKHLLDEDMTESEQNTLPSLKPRRERSSSVAHGESVSSTLSNPHSLPPLPPRRNSTPIPVSEDLVESSVQGIPRTHVMEAAITEEPDTGLDDHKSVEERPPLPTTPRPLYSDSKPHPIPDLPPRNIHSPPPAIPPRH
ncbi:hypothetical protein INT47_006735 [Mucor saturninus]|uniref:SMP-LTD domain-containing protein n=1 Tax=Mucor saturninus TaxID=64648 RepID=A0A8H7UYJ4_9FUNG|nr:hypothetical protein INT47_006735 [Mucor saturninus]